MYLSSPAWLAFLLLGLIRQLPFRMDLGVTLFILMLAMGLAPKLATLADVLARSELRRAYGGATRIVASVFLEFFVTMLIAPISAVAVTLFLLGLPFGQQVGWGSQQRDAEGVTFLMAARALWPQTILGVVLAVSVWQIAPGVAWYWAPLVLGLIGAIPLAMATAHPPVGRALAATGLCRVPEETRLPAGSERAGLFMPFASAPMSATPAVAASK
jgi:membrane glycosyltransferase